MTEKELDRVIEVTDRFLPKRLEESLKKIQSGYNENPGILLKDFFDCLDRLFLRTAKMQENRQKPKVAAIYFSFLYSNVLLNKNGFRVETLSRELFLDDAEVYEMWLPEYLFEYAEADMKKAERILSSEYIRIKEYELLELKNSYLLNYYMAAENFIIGAARQIETMKSYRRMKRQKEVKVIVGEYRNVPHCICTFQAEEDDC